VEDSLRNWNVAALRMNGGLPRKVSVFSR
jgi:hypothetical protein